MSLPSTPTPPAVQPPSDQPEEVPETQVIAHGNTAAPPTAVETVLLLVGEDETPMSAPKHLLVTIPFFEGMFTASSRFQEDIENKVTLPEDDPELWRKALEFLQTGKFFPYFKANDRSSTPSLDITLLVADAQGTFGEWDGSDARCGFEILSDETHEVFEDLGHLLRLAEQYLWAELLEACVQKIKVFPISRRGFKMLLRLGISVFQYCDDMQTNGARLDPFQVWGGSIGGPLLHYPHGQLPDEIPGIEGARVKLFLLINGFKMQVTWSLVPWRWHHDEEVIEALRGAVEEFLESD